MRAPVILASLAAFWLMLSPAYADFPIADRIVARIEAEGYTVTEVRRSWFGRIVITANNNTDLREVVLNRSSGEILRDQRFPNENPDVEVPQTPSSQPGRPDRTDRPDGRGNQGGQEGQGGPGGPGGPGGSGKGGG